MRRLLYIQQVETPAPERWAALEMACAKGEVEVTLVVLPGFYFKGAPKGCKVLRMVGDCAGNYTLPALESYDEVIYL